MADKRERVMMNILHMGHTVTSLEAKVYEWMTEVNDRYIFSLSFPTARPIPNNRNGIVKRFLEGDWDRLFMIDNDVLPLKNPFPLMDHDKDVCAGVYPGRDSKGVHMHCYKFGPKGADEVLFFQYNSNEWEGLKKVDAVGSGVMTIKRHVLEKIERPFEEWFDDKGTLVTSDDMGFCLKCAKAGIEVWADWSHVGSHFKEMDLLEVIRLISEAARSGQAVINKGMDLK
jgi:hypothetical protein